MLMLMKSAKTSSLSSQPMINSWPWLPWTGFCMMNQAETYWSSFYLILQTKTSLQVHLLMIWSGLLLQTSRTRSLECLVTPWFLQLWRSTTGALILFPHHVANLRLSKLHLASSSLTWSMYQTKLVQSNKI